MRRYKQPFIQENVRGDFGSLVVSVFINSIGQPAPDALIRVYDPTSSILIEETRTDAVGQMQPITLPAPPISYSLNPDEGRPFNLFNVSVYLPGFIEANVYNVQIYPRTTAIQQVILNPTYESVDIPYPTLWGDFPPKIPEEEIKKLPFPGGLVVLPEPVVPEFVVVHDGVPENTGAANYTMGFKDYIKNVASSEIYATWPIEALKANILAQISFTMNRVYTEWYRSKGYGFTITNSTAYDQAFSYGRNIYKEVSDIVDELFTTYISRPGLAQPLFTQYSDGIKVVRDGWLSQWGSKYLAESGYTALQILKNYYGSDIVLRQAEKVEGIPMSFPGYVLEIGSSGEPVRTIQNQLNAISKNFPLIPKLVEDGVYGENTATAVRRFQEIFKMPVTGKVDFATWYRISSIFIAVEKLAG